jgi:hypothetical protein
VAALAGRGVRSKRWPEADLHVQVFDDEIVVTLPGTSYTVTYYYRAATFSQQLLTKSPLGPRGSGCPDDASRVSRSAWKLANGKARELGWIV